jgi:tetratricopeptide (TPR) repeat protein
LSKENAVAYAIALPALLRAFLPAEKGGGDSRVKNWPWLAGPTLLVLAVYFGLRSWSGFSTIPPGHFDLGAALGNILRAAGYYLTKTVFPWPQNHLVSALPPLAPALAAVLLALAALAALYRCWARGRRHLLALAAFYLAALAPAFALLFDPAAPNLVAERYLYLPSVAVAILAGFGAARALEKNRRAVLAALGAVLVAFAAGTFTQSRVWLDNVSFWEDAARSEGNAADGNVANNLAESYRLAGRYNDAIAVLERAVGSDAAATGQLRAHLLLKLGSTHLFRAQAELDAGRAAEARADVDRGLGLLSQVGRELEGEPFFYAFTGSGYLLRAKLLKRETGRFDSLTLSQARGYLLKARQLDPRNDYILQKLEECERLLREVQGR